MKGVLSMEVMMRYKVGPLEQPFELLNCGCDREVAWSYQVNNMLDGTGFTVPIMTQYGGIVQGGVWHQ